ncbi:hypothetical protein GOBAR_AA06104 [Gossypium barbadense]|uniref:cysteine desulfurase n=1 Tax=Gossypium barbadense TaxID=3634 RepID=A0A2P5YFU6_GOSBA|nr:hypothetical protein GOBAR_AA06104 [Gossypium barbadense]
MEGLVVKLPSFPFLSPNISSSSSSSTFRLGFRRLSASISAAVKEGSVSLGQLTRPDFPILHQEVNGSKLVYLDNAATSQKPTAVAKATDEYELAWKKVAAFINASDSAEIVFTRNATEAINLVAYSWGLSNLKPRDEIILTIAEHHSAIVPWQIVAQKTGAILKFVSLDENEVPDVEKLREMISTSTKLVVVHHVSNVLGSVLPIEDIVIWAHAVGAKVLVDACQSVPHMVVDVQGLDADFLVASSHKMCGPTGIGFLFGKSNLLLTMPPFLGGGEMISDVFLDHSTYAEPPSRFEAGTPAIGEAIGLGAAIDYLSGIGMQKIHDYEHGVAIRSGHHCAQPLHHHLGVNASARASLHFYNTEEDVDNFIQSLNDTVSFFNSFK